MPLPTPQEIKSRISISDVLKHYGGVCVNQSSGSWWCLIHENGGKNTGHKTPSLVANNEIGAATCLSRMCFQSDDIFGVIAKMEGLDVKRDFETLLKRACDIGGIGTHYTQEEAPISKSTICALEPKHLNYLKALGISEATANFFGLKARNNYILYPQVTNGNIIGYKGIAITRGLKSDKKRMFFEGQKASIWGNAQDVTGKHLIFTEGEKDCLRLFEELKAHNAEHEYAVLTTTTGAQAVPNDISEIIKHLNPSNISIIYDNDKAGADGSRKLADTIIKQYKKVTVYHLSSSSHEGYDITDFLQEGNELDSIWSLQSTVFKKEVRTIQSSYPGYALSEDTLLETLTPDRVLHTGYEDIDTKCPIVTGENSIIVGRTGKGKTVLGVNFVNGILRHNENAKVIVFSLELKKRSFLQRLFAAEYNIKTWRIKKGFCGNDDISHDARAEYLQRVGQYISNYRDRFLIVDDLNSVEQIEKMLEDLEYNLGYIPDYILIDYANILTFKNLTDTAKHIQISTWIKFLAKTKGIHVQAICQAGRTTKENDDGYARTENLADSDQYGRDAFVIYSIKTDKATDIYSINPTKNRNGKPEETIQLHWNPESGKILNQVNKDILNRL